MPVLGKRSNQRGLFEADTMYLEFVGRDGFYGYLASQRGKLFRDEDFADLYCHTNGRNSVPPSLLARALILQTYDGVGDAEAKGRADYDMRWLVLRSGATSQSSKGGPGHRTERAPFCQEHAPAFPRSACHPP